MTAGTYVRISRSRRTISHRAVSSPLSLAFIDPVVDWPVTLPSVDQLLLDATPAVFDADLVVVRVPTMPPGAVVDPEGAAAALLETIHDGRFSMFFGGALATVAFRAGYSPALVSDVDLSADATLATLRELELAALLDWGSGIWRLKGAHFRLPNGRHSPTFVRVEHAFQSSRDIEVVADWLATGLREGTGVLLDSSSVLAVGFRLDVLSREAGFGALRVRSLPHYPSSFDEVSDAVEDSLTMGGRGGVLALVTASSSGRLTGYLTRKFDELGIQRAQIHLLVERSADARIWLSAPPRQQERNVWMVLEPDDGGAECVTCASATDAPVVLIDPRTYDPFPFPVPSLQAPDEVPMYVNRPLLRLATATRAIDVGYRSSEPDAPRSRARMGVRFSYERLFDLPAEELDGAMRESVRHLEVLARRDDDIGLALTSVRQCEVALYREAEAGGSSDSAVRRALQSLLAALGLGHIDLVALRKTGETYFVEPSDLSALAGRRIAMLHVGLVTGWNARRALEFIRNVPEAEESEVAGLVLHARPESYDVWNSIRQLFDGRCLSLWHTPLPWGSPLEDERRLLERFAGANPEVQGNAFLVHRLALTADGWPGVSADAPPLFWTDVNSPGLTTTSSPFGSRVDAASAFAAAGSAVGLARYRALHGQRPAWVAFDIRRLAVERYDALSFAGVLRWLRPGEAWWGSSPSDVRSTAELVCDLVAMSEDPVMGLAELLLACAFGKVPSEAEHVFLHQAASYDEVHPPLEVSRLLLRWLRSDPSAAPARG